MVRQAHHERMGKFNSNPVRPELVEGYELIIVTYIYINPIVHGIITLVFWLKI
jgi:hypothetical protein